MSRNFLIQVLVYMGLVKHCTDSDQGSLTVLQYRFNPKGDSGALNFGTGELRELDSYINGLRQMPRSENI